MARTFEQYLEDAGFQADACKGDCHPDFYELASRLYDALETIASHGMTSVDCRRAMGALRY